MTGESNGIGDLPESVHPVLTHIERNFGASLQRYLDFLRIPSISTDLAFENEVERAAIWLRDYLDALGFSVTVHETPRHPIVVAHHASGLTDSPHLLYYGHYDVQPVDPLEQWTSPPFEPALVEGPHGPRVVARGAVDDKGQVMTFLEALKAWKEVHGQFPAEITLLLEGEEECGSHSLPGFLDRHAGELRKADIVLVTDTNAWDIDTAAITYRLRGLAYFEITIQGPSHDLHSGLYGGAAVNPINALTEILGGLHNGGGRVQIPGFYDDVLEPSANEKAALDALAFDDKAFLSEIGLQGTFGETGRTVPERLWTRPTCDINGIWGGYTGPGAKTVIASRASAKLSCRLVPNQDPAKIAASLEAYLRARAPSGCRVSVENFGGSPGVIVPIEGPFMQAARAGLADIFGRPAALVGSGGSIPVVGLMKEKIGRESILVGFGLADDRIHSPNEKFELKCLKNGILSHAAILGRFGQLRKSENLTG